MNPAMLPMGAFGAFGPKKMGQFGLFGAPGMMGMQQQPKQQEEEKPSSWFDGGKFGAKDALALALGAIGDGLTRRPMTSQMILGNMMNKRQMEQQEKMRQQQRMEGREDKRDDYMWQRQYDIANPMPSKPSGPQLREDNAGNVWQFDEQTGQPLGDKPVWVDPTEKVIYQDGMQIRVPNPYRPGNANTGGANLPTVSDQASYDAVPAGEQYRDAQGNVRTKQGGPSQPATGNFPQPL